ncbi:MAG: flagellar export chaperone FliS [Oscillospiraceae bacterium]
MNYRQNNLKNEYLKQSVLTASPIELIIMLFDACIKDLKLAQICLEEHRDIAGAGEHFINAQKIIMELTNCLDTRFELSESLLKVYDYLLFAIRQMNVKKDLSLLPNVLDMLESIRDTWEQVKSGGCRTAEVS